MFKLSAQDKARLSWHCRRGMLELDLILERFIPRLDTLNEHEIQLFDHLLSTPDPQLFAWLMGHEDPEDTDLRTIVAVIRANT